MKDAEMPDGMRPLRHLFGEAPTPAIDLDVVVRRSRARRVPKVLGIGVAGVLALGGVVTVAVQVLPAAAPISASDSAGGSAEQSTGTFDLESTAKDATGLVVDLDVTGTAGPADLVMTNLGTEPVSGEVTSVAVSLLEADTVIAQVLADMQPLRFELAPGETLTVQAPVPEVPATATAGALQLVASLSLTIGTEATPVVIETGPRAFG